MANEMKKDNVMTLGDLLELLPEHKDVSIHQYDQHFEYPRTIKNIDMMVKDKIYITVASQEDESTLSGMYVSDMLVMVEQHKKMYNTPLDTPVVMYDPELDTTYEGLALDLSILDRVDINCMGDES